MHNPRFPSQEPSSLRSPPDYPDSPFRGVSLPHRSTDQLFPCSRPFRPRGTVNKTASIENARADVPLKPRISRRWRPRSFRAMNFYFLFPGLPVQAASTFAPRLNPKNISLFLRAYAGFCGNLRLKTFLERLAWTQIQVNSTSPEFNFHPRAFTPNREIQADSTSAPRPSSQVPGLKPRVSSLRPFPYTSPPMKALVYNITPARWVLCWLGGLFTKRAFYGPLSALRLVDRPIPPLPGPGWVRLKTIL